MQEINQNIVDNFFSDNICKCGTKYEYYRNSKVAKLCPKCYSNSWIEHDRTLFKYPKFEESKNYVIRQATESYPECNGFPRSRFGFVWLTTEQSKRIDNYTSRSEMLDYPHIVFVPTEPKPKCETNPVTIFLISVIVCIIIADFIMKG